MNQKSLPSGMIGAILLFLVAAYHILSGSINGKNLLYYLGLVVIGVGVLMGNYLVSIIGAGVSALLDFIWLILDIKNEVMFIWIWYGLAFLAALVCLIVFILPYITSSLPVKDLRKMWFLPGALALVGYLPSFFYSISNYDHYLTGSFVYILFTLMYIAGLFFIGHAICTQPAVKAFSGAGATPGAASGTSAAPGASVTPAAQVAPAAPAVTPDSIGMIRKYKELLDAGIITQEEFDERKKKILG